MFCKSYAFRMSVVLPVSSPSVFFDNGPLLCTRLRSREQYNLFNTHFAIVSRTGDRYDRFEYSAYSYAIEDDFEINRHTGNKTVAPRPTASPQKIEKKRRCSKNGEKFILTDTTQGFEATGRGEGLNPTNSHGKYPWR